ncbi:MAG: hypothetical protein EPN92_01160 [Chitinophagaceae bacterium]|nr:MAG: hypothetical protein EPN92_01160 [Chitinophagaceae bacterium]
MRRVNTRGIKQAAKCILMSAVAYNLKKLLKWESRKIKVMAVANLPGRQAGRKEVKNTLQSLFLSLFPSLRLRVSL